VDGAEQHAAVAPDHAAGWAFEWSGDELELPGHRPLLPDRHAGDVQPRAEHRVIRGHVERAPIVVAPREVGGWPTGNEQPAEHLAGGIEDMDTTRPGAVDVPLAVALHAVGHAGLAACELMEQPSIADAAVRRNVEGADMRHAGVVHVKDLLVGAEAE